jgi:hypothetical protein
VATGVVGRAAEAIDDLREARGNSLRPWSGVANPAQDAILPCIPHT